MYLFKYSFVRKCIAVNVNLIMIVSEYWLVFVGTGAWAVLGRDLCCTDLAIFGQKTWEKKNMLVSMALTY